MSGSGQSVEYYMISFKLPVVFFLILLCVSVVLQSLFGDVVSFCRLQMFVFMCACEVIVAF